MAEDDEHPFVKTLPPATDYVNYLIVVEHNLTRENLPILHKVLQDQKLTTNIGWDLVHTLLPLLPDSADCLQDVARLGNPREVILKVTESLRILDFEQGEDDESEAAASPVAAMESLKVSDQESKPGVTSPTDEANLTRPLKVMQFQALLNMLSILHPRIKAKLPSRFLSTSLQAVLSCYSQADTHVDELTASVVKFCKTISGTKRPHLPPRTSSGMVPRTSSQQSAPDPEAQDEPVSAQESAIQAKLLQSFVTHVIEVYAGSFTASTDAPGLSWTSRLMEKLHPDRNVPGRKTFAERYAEEEFLQARVAITGQLFALAQDLRLFSKDLIKVIIEPQKAVIASVLDEDDPPESADDIPLSKIGALLILTSRKASEYLYGTLPSTEPIPVFPTQATLLANFLTTESPLSVGREPEATVDALIALSLLALEANNVGDDVEDEAFADYISTVSLLSANAPSPSLRSHANYIATTVLRSHPSDVFRLRCIRDTLEHCPFPNLKTSTVSWLKGEIIDANVVDPLSQVGDDEITKPSSIFATPVAIKSCAEFLFPDIAASTEILTPELPAAEVAMAYKMEASFFLASLNLYILLLLAPHLRDAVEVKDLAAGSPIHDRFVLALEKVQGRLFSAGSELGEDDEIKGDAMLLEMVLKRLHDALKTVEHG